MARLLAVGAMAVTLLLGGASAVEQDAHDAWHAMHSSTNTVSKRVTNGIVNLHNDLPPSSTGS
jgi:hypothetical protein